MVKKNNYDKVRKNWAFNVFTNLKGIPENILIGNIYGTESLIKKIEETEGLPISTKKTRIYSIFPSKTYEGDYDGALGLLKEVFSKKSQRENPYELKGKDFSILREKNIRVEEIPYSS